mmetsp:Transcript_58717/g.94917  ORF Transcript_58717/g.94917 Transcript_58717/m.94917 type:complete len:787 (-) Transcript_58717:1506-3866(-)
MWQNAYDLAQEKHSGAIRQLVDEFTQREMAIRDELQSRADTAIEHLREDVEMQNERLQMCEDQKRNAEAQERETKRQLATVEDQNRRLQQELNDAKRELDGLTTELSQCKESNELKLKSMQEHMLRAIRDKEDQEAYFTTKILSLSNNNQELRQQIEALSQQVAALQGTTVQCNNVVVQQMIAKCQAATTELECIRNENELLKFQKQTQVSSIAELKQTILHLKETNRSEGDFLSAMEPIITANTELRADVQQLRTDIHQKDQLFAKVRQGLKDMISNLERQLHEDREASDSERRVWQAKVDLLEHQLKVAQGDHTKAPVSTHPELHHSIPEFSSSPDVSEVATAITDSLLRRDCPLKDDVSLDMVLSAQTHTGNLELQLRPQNTMTNPNCSTIVTAAENVNLSSTPPPHPLPHDALTPDTKCDTGAAPIRNTDPHTSCHAFSPPSPASPALQSVARQLHMPPGSMAHADLTDSCGQSPKCAAFRSQCPHTGGHVSSPSACESTPAHSSADPESCSPELATQARLPSGCPSPILQECIGALVCSSAQERQRQTREQCKGPSSVCSAGQPVLAECQVLPMTRAVGASSMVKDVWDFDPKIYARIITAAAVQPLCQESPPDVAHTQPPLSAVSFAEQLQVSKLLNQQYHAECSAGKYGPRTQGHTRSPRTELHPPSALHCKGKGKPQDRTAKQSPARVQRRMRSATPLRATSQSQTPRALEGKDGNKACNKEGAKDKEKARRKHVDRDGDRELEKEREKGAPARPTKIHATPSLASRFPDRRRMSPGV